MALMTYFRARKPCPRCRHDGSVWIPSHLGSLGATYEVGDCPGDDIPIVDFEDTSFTVRPPEPGEAIHFLASWTCESCRLESLAEVTFAHGCVEAIDVVQLDPGTLERVHFIEESLEEILERLVGHSLRDQDGLSANWMSDLRTALLAGNRPWSISR